jgi:hypothetical protein
MKQFHAFVTSATGSIMNFFCILTRAHTFSIFLLNSMDDSNKKPSPSSSPAYPDTFESIHGDGSPGDPMSLDELAVASKENHSDTEMEDRCMAEGDF